MKKALILLTVMLLPFSCSDNTKGEQVVMKGVKTMTVTEVEANMRFGVLSYGDTLKVTVCRFDENGYVIQSDEYDEDGLQKTETFVWSDNEKHCESTLTHHSHSVYFPSLIYKTYSDYNNDGKITYLKRCYKEEPTSETWYAYDNNGNILTEKETSYGDYLHTSVTSYTYQFDKKGRILYSESTYVFIWNDKKENESVTESSYTYNRDGSYTIESYVADDEIRVEKYNKNGVILESYYQEKNAKQPYSKDIYEYDSKGRVLKHTAFRDEVPNTILLYEYELY